MAGSEPPSLTGFFDALKPLRVRHEVVLLDTGHSNAQSVLARSRGARVLRVEWKGLPETRRSAFSRCRGDWIWVLDGDERPDGALLAAVERALTREAPGPWTLRRVHYFLGRPMLHGEWRPDEPLRLFPRGWGRKDRRAGGPALPSAHAEPGFRRLEGLLRHERAPDISAYLRRLNRVSSRRAEALFQRYGARPGLAVAGMLLLPPTAFLARYGFQLGFLDGEAGLSLGLLSASATFWSYAKWWHRSWTSQGGSAGVPWPLRRTLQKGAR